jgi:hypothetical protein
MLSAFNAGLTVFNLIICWRSPGLEGPTLISQQTKLAVNLSEIFLQKMRPVLTVFHA